MTKQEQWSWLAGIVEGEGSFWLEKGHHQKGVYPALTIQMSDEDVMNRVGKMLGKRVRRVKITNYPGALDGFKVSCTGQDARIFMMCLYPYLSKRRRDKIADLWNTWKGRKSNLGKGATNESS